MRPELHLPGIAETMLPDDLVARLPTDAPPAPWTCRSDAVVWTARAHAGARQALAPAVRAQASVLNVVGGMVRYTDTPVGPYNELFGNIGLRRGLKPCASVALMAVDKPESLVGGRMNWAMPKSLATFAGVPEPGTQMSATASDWEVHVRAHALGPAVPLGTTLLTLQQWPDGIVRESRMKVAGRVRPALVHVRVRAEPSLSGWFRSGRHLGSVLTDLTFTLEQSR